MHVWFTNCEQSRKNLKSIQHFCFQNIKPFKTLQSVKCRSISRSWQEYSNLWNAQWLLRRVEHAPGGRRKACWASVRMGSRKKWFIMSTFKLGICGIRYWSDSNLERISNEERNVSISRALAYKVTGHGHFTYFLDFLWILIERAERVEISETTWAIWC